MLDVVLVVSARKNDVGNVSKVYVTARILHISLKFVEFFVPLVTKKVIAMNLDFACWNLPSKGTILLWLETRNLLHTSTCVTTFRFAVRSLQLCSCWHGSGRS